MKQKLEIIDWERKGNLIRFYLGKNGKQYGDDWNDIPYEHNAGSVYEEFIQGYKDIIVPFEQDVFEPCDGHVNSHYCKEDMIERKVPCIVVVSSSAWHHTFEQALADDKSRKYYFGDKLE